MNAPAADSGRRRQPVLAVCGNPNTGKSTLFNALTGLRQKVANYPGVTVEKHTGQLELSCGDTLLVDVPGTYSLAAHSPDEMVAVDVLLGHMDDLPAPNAVLVVVDASNLRRNLFLLSQILELGLPTVVALNMVDVAERQGIEIDATALAAELGATVVPVVAAKGIGLEALRKALGEVCMQELEPRFEGLEALREPVAALLEQVREDYPAVSPYEIERALIDKDYAEQRLNRLTAVDLSEPLAAARAAVGGSLAGLEAKQRYAWAGEIVNKVEVRGEPVRSVSERIDSVLSHPVLGLMAFFLLMATVFQAVFAWSAPLMDGIDSGAGLISAWLEARLPEGALRSLLVDGMVAGVGAVVIFLPQILILFLFIIVLEDTGYMARAAFLMDRVMRSVGLSGTSFIPMLSSFACAVPGIMATRVIPNRRDRLATMLAAPFMTCSARLPVYALLIAAFVPAQSVAGFLSLQGLVLLGLYLLGVVGGMFTAWLLKRTALKGDTPGFLMELPPYRMPNIKSVLLRLLERGRIFLRRAGTVIFSVAVVIWALAYFPHSDSIYAEYAARQAAVSLELPAEEREARLAALDNERAAAHLEDSYLGRIGQTIEPVFEPLGWDWKVSAAVVASFPAREVVIAVLGTIYAVGGEVDESDAGLIDRIRGSTWPDGRLVFSLPMALGLMVFYAFCLQCVATVATIRREANSWAWALGAWTYMTGLGYLAAWFTYRAALALGL